MQSLLSFIKNILMKKLLVSTLALAMWISSVFGAYSPSMEEQKKVDSVWAVVINLVETKMNGNYDLLISVLKSFIPKVAGDERREWILDTMINLAMEKSGAMMKDDMMHQEEMMKNDMMKDDSMMDTHTMSPLMPLENVVGNQTIRWISFNWTEMWSASSTTTSAGTHVFAQFDSLPDAGPDNFYEGWIVRMSGWVSVLSTGELEMRDGSYVNDWMIWDDIADHTFYVLTLEPNDNDPAPADHILEAHVN